MRQSTLANGAQGLEVADSPPHASSSAAKKRRNEPVRHAFATQPDPDELQDGESLDEDEDDEDPALTTESPAKSRHSTSAAAAAAESEGEDSSASNATTSSDEDVVVVLTPKKKKKKKAARAPSSSPVASRAVTPVLVLTDDSEDEDGVPIMSSMHKPAINMFDDEAEEASDLSEEERGVAPRRVGQGKRARPSSQMVISSDNSDDEDLPAPPSSRDARKAKLESMQKKKRKAPSPSPSSHASSSSDSDRPVPSSSKGKSSNPPKRRKRASSSAAKKSYARDGGRRSADEVSNSDVDDFIDDDDSLLGEGSESSRSSSPPAKGKGKGKVVVRGGKDKGRRAGMSQKQKGKRRAVESDSGTNDEDDDDLELSGKETVLPERLRKSSPRRSQLLKKRKATYMGAESPPESESESASASGNASGSDGSDDSPKRREDLDADLSDFLEEDDEEEVDDVVAKYREDMTRKAQGQKLHVKTFLQYLVHLIVCPTVDWYKSDQNFAQSYDRVTRDLEGMTSSLIGSNAWRKGFKRAIDERPSFQMDDIDPSLVGASCDACTMGAKRHSKFTAITSGKRYDPKTFKDLPDDALTHSDDSDSDDVAETDDGKAHNLGEFCAGRAEVYHDLRHWAWEAYQDLKSAVKPIKTKYPKLKKATREEKKGREDLLAADADRVAVALDESGKIKSLAEGLERMIDSATKNFAIK